MSLFTFHFSLSYLCFLYYRPRAAITKHHKRGSLNNRNVASLNSGSQKSEIKALARLSLRVYSRVRSIPFSYLLEVLGSPWLVDTSLRSLPVSPHGYLSSVSIRVFSPLLTSTLVILDLNQPYSAWPYLNLIISAMAPFQWGHIHRCQGVRTSMYLLRGYNSTHNNMLISQCSTYTPTSLRRLFSFLQLILHQTFRKWMIHWGTNYGCFVHSCISGAWLSSWSIVRTQYLLSKSLYSTSTWIYTI